ncbi:hypothetical protein [Neisseria yangbaofengii]|nr:hypothetical protein [Neisseria yangbaofengii]
MSLILLRLLTISDGLEVLRCDAARIATKHKNHTKTDCPVSFKAV